MSTSQNGWTVILADGPQLTTIPKIIGRVRAGDVATIFAALIAFLDAHVEDLDQGADEWGWNVRPIRGQTTGYSNHASATAIDVNAMQHPRGKRGTWTAAQKSTVHAYLTGTLDGVVRWGEDYPANLSIIDPMHFEINASAAAVAKVAAKLKGTPAPAPAHSAKPAASKPAGKPVAPQSKTHAPDGSTSFPTDYEDLDTDGKLGALTVGAHQILMHAIGARHNGRWDGKLEKLTVTDTQAWLQSLGYYEATPFAAKGVKKGTPLRVDGGAGYWFWVEMQRFLASKHLYAGKVDGDPKTLTITAWQKYLNTQNGK